MSLEGRKARGQAASFLKTLHNLLRHAEEKEFSHIVSWASHGRAFRVHNSEAFVNVVMPQYFRQNKFASFQRQLSIYGFQRMTKRGPDQGSYWHALFLRGMPHLTEKMQRITVKGKGVRTPYTPETEPDFHAMPPVGEASLSSAETASKVAALPPVSVVERPHSSLNAKEAAPIPFEGESSAYLASVHLPHPLLASTIPSTTMPSTMSSRRPAFRDSVPHTEGLPPPATAPSSTEASVGGTLPPRNRGVTAPLEASPPRMQFPAVTQHRRPIYSEADTMDLAFFLDDVDFSAPEEQGHSPS